MSSVSESRTDAVAELIRVLREQVTQNARRIADLERQLDAAHDRIQDQQRLLARLLERGIESTEPPTPAPVSVAYSPSVRERIYPRSAAASEGPVVPVPSPLSAGLGFEADTVEGLVQESQDVIKLAVISENRVVESEIFPLADSVAPRDAPVVPLVSAERFDFERPPVTASDLARPTPPTNWPIPHANPGPSRMRRKPAGAGRPEEERRTVMNSSGHKTPNIEIVADAVFAAMAAPKSGAIAESNDYNPPVASHRPTRGVIRSGPLEHPESTPPTPVTDSTLTMDREALAKGHRAQETRKRWFPFLRT